jgi:hypothetical protein
MADEATTATVIAPWPMATTAASRRSSRRSSLCWLGVFRLAAALASAVAGR